LSLENKDFTILTILSNAVKNMSEGELLQMEKTRNLNFDESVYYEIINGKTASLLASSCAAGASSVSNDSEVIEQMRAFGENVGMAFQIKDDLFDYGEAKVGKPTGNDIKEKKLTLPLIHILQKVTPALKKKIIFIVKNNNNDKAQVKFVIDNVVSNGGIEYATEKMIEYRDKALTILHSFPKSSCRDALEELVRYTTDRKF
jgi:octaprenyl-diphosphate synthase